MNLENIAPKHGGARDVKRAESYNFANVKDMLSTLSEMGLTLHVPFTPDRRCTLIVRGRNLIARVARLPDDPNDSQWTYGKGFIERHIKNSPLPDVSDRYRCCEVDGHQAGWRAKTDAGHWTEKNASSVRTMLLSEEFSRREADCLLGRMELDPWSLVSRPFENEYPEADKRIWNLGAAQLRFEPAPGPHPTWDRIFDHVGSELGERGHDWLMSWFAALIQNPRSQLPYIFLFGPQDSGKSILHESFELLVTKGVVRADRALTSKSDFNGELAGAICCVVEERDLSKSPGAYAKIKDAVTSLKLSIRKMRQDSYMIDYTSHWMQCANEATACVLSWADTRIQVFHVPPVKDLIPKPLLIPMLETEGPAITHSLLSYKLPEAKGRLAIELIETASRRELCNQATPAYVRAIADYIDECGSFHGTAGQLRERVAAHAENDIVAADELKASWPRDFRAIVGLLGSAASFLSVRGITFEHGKKTERRDKTDDLGLLAMIQGWSDCPVTPESVGEELFGDSSIFVGKDESFIRDFVRGVLCG